MLEAIILPLTKHWVFRLIKHKNIDKLKWDACLAASTNHNWFMASWYLDAVAPHWMGVIKNDYQLIFPLVPIRNGIPKYHQPFFTRAFSLMGNGNTEDKMALQSFLKKQWALGYTHVEGMDLEQNMHYQCLDTGSVNYNTNCSRNIKKAIKSGLVVQTIGISEFVNHYRKENSTRFKEYKNKHYKHLNQLLLSADHKHMLRLKSASINKKIVAVAAFLVNGDKALYLCAALTDKGRKLGAGHLLVHHFLENQAANLESLDFGGSQIEGVARFYKSFGAQDVTYHYLPIGFTSNKTD